MFLLLLIAVVMQTAAQDSTAVHVTCERIANSDTLWVTAKIKPGSKAGSLMLVATAKGTEVTDTMYYPLVAIENNFELVVPENFATALISIKGYYYPGIFQIKGKLNSRKISEEMLVYLFAQNNTIYNKIVDINEEKEFSMPRLVFEKKASLFFNFVNTKRKVKPDISIQQFPQPGDFTDSVFHAQFDFSEGLMTGFQYDSLKKAGKLPYNAVAVEGKGKELQQIIVTGTRKTKLDKYKEEYTTPLFSDIMEREFDCLSNDDILHFQNCLDYLQNKAPGLMITNDDKGEQVVIWRREKIKAFFIDEMEVDINQLMGLDVSSIAYMKILPSLLAGSSLGGPGSGGAIVVYTRKGEYVRQGTNDNNWIFSVKGYTPAEHVLFSKE